MLTVLDEARSWSLESLAYADGLCAVVVEGFVSDRSEDLRVGEHVLTGLHPIERSATSRRARVRFTRVVAWQVVDESYTSWDESEVRDDKGFLVALSKSAYLSFVDEHHGWYKDVVGPATHYRLWTEDEVIDVVAHDKPIVQLVAGT